MKTKIKDNIPKKKIIKIKKMRKIIIKKYNS